MGRTHSPSSLPPRKRRSKACESCRSKKIKCVGGAPCQDCRTGGRAERCTFRSKARPKRSEAEESSSTIAPAHAKKLWHQAKTSDADNTDRNAMACRFTLDTLDMELMLCCFEHDILFDDLLFEESNRLGLLKDDETSDALEVCPLEPTLFDAFISSSDASGIQVINIDELRRIHSRYRAAPRAVTGDQVALILAVYCLVAHHHISRRSHSTVGWKLPNSDYNQPKHDVKYYFASRKKLKEFSESSIYTLWALCALLHYSMIKGGPVECRDLVRDLGRQLRRMNINCPRSAVLYPEQDNCKDIFITYIHADVFISGLLGSLPDLLENGMNVPSVRSILSSSSHVQQAMLDELRLLQDLADADIDTIATPYISKSEKSWSGTMKQIRLQPNLRGGAEDHSGAELRYCWLRILLQCGNLKRCSSVSATSILMRCASQMLSIYRDIDSLGLFCESWPHLRQLTSCAHIVILATAAGELHHDEATQIWSTLIVFLDRLAQHWTSARRMVATLRKAVSIYNVVLRDVREIPS